MISLEIFAANDPEGVNTTALIAVPGKCGLAAADTLSLRGQNLVALRGQMRVDVVLPALDSESRELLINATRTNRRVIVAEFNAIGVVATYALNFEAGG